MCNLYSITTNQAAIAALFRVVNRYVGNLARVVIAGVKVGSFPHMSVTGVICRHGFRRSDVVVELECTEHPTAFIGAIVLDCDIYLKQTHFIATDLVGIIGSLGVGDPLRRAIEVWHLIFGCRCKKQLECDRTLRKCRFSRVRMIWVRPYASDRVAAASVIKTNGEITEGA